MYRKKNKKSFKKAFSLVELAVTITVISVVAVAFLPNGASNKKQQKNLVTNERMKVIYKAMGNFLLTNKRLPCPASVDKTTSEDSNYGKEIGGNAGCVGTGVYQSTIDTNLVYGMVPIRDLGLSTEFAKDGFDGKFAYVIDKRFTNSCNVANPNFTVATFCTTTPTNIITINENINNISKTKTTDAIFAIITYGENQSGSYNSNSKTKNILSSNLDEKSNSLDTSNNFDKTIVAYVNNDQNFDDTVFYKTRNDMINDFVGAIYLIPCNIDQISNFGTSSVSYGKIVYSVNDVCTKNNKKFKFSKKCEAKGVWVDVVSTCPA
jgi:prepilin-type N-terminal cleavage/methylation domain-containing protein